MTWGEGTKKATSEEVALLRYFRGGRVEIATSLSLLAMTRERIEIATSGAALLAMTYFTR